MTYYTFKAFCWDIGEKTSDSPFEVRSFDEPQDAFSYLERVLKYTHKLVKRTEGHLMDECLKLAQKAVHLAESDPALSRNSLYDIRELIQAYDDSGDGWYDSAGSWKAQGELRCGEPVFFADAGKYYKYYVKRLDSLVDAA